MIQNIHFLSQGPIVTCFILPKQEIFQFILYVINIFAYWKKLFNAIRTIYHFIDISQFLYLQGMIAPRWDEELVLIKRLDKNVLCL